MAGTSKVSIPTVEISTLATFLEEIQKLPRSPHLFRGQGHDFDLKPKIARLKPMMGETPETMERRMLDDLKRRAGSYFKDTLLRPDNDWDWLALAQHHGMATRLLYWSDNPLIGLFFAVEKAFNPKKAPGDKCPIVWVFRVEEDALINLSEKFQTPFESYNTRVFRPNHVTPRIVAQSGWFTVHPFHHERGHEKGYEPFKPLQQNSTYSRYLTKFTIRPESVGELRRLLRTCGIHVGSVYPDLQGLCADITERFAYQPDETHDTFLFREEMDVSIDDNNLSVVVSRE